MNSRVSVHGRTLLRHTRTALQRMQLRLASVAGATACTALALALPTVLLLLVGNVGELVRDWRDNHTLSVYLDPALEDADGDALAEQWQVLESVEDARVITRAQAAREFGEATGAGDLITALGENPLPVVVQLWPARGFADTGSVRALSDIIAHTPGVDDIDLDITWLERADAVLNTLTRGAAVISTLLALIAVALIGSSVRQQVSAHAEEIALSKLLGATDSALRTPFLLSGAIMGLLAGLLALAVTAGVQAVLAEPIGALAATYQSRFQLQPIGAGLGLALATGAAVIGALGAAVAIELRLRRIQPD